MKATRYFSVWIYLTDKSSVGIKVGNFYKYSLAAYAYEYVINDPRFKNCIVSLDTRFGDVPFDDDILFDNLRAL